jgi:metal-responsive CopG/Arc/MetJ family transcriptional regulator
MTAISLILPDDLARESKKIAHKLGISRTELIRRALEHEIANAEAILERDAMAGAFEAMRASNDYLAESNELDQSLETKLPDEVDHWWQK